MLPIKKTSCLTLALVVAGMLLTACEREKPYPSQTINGLIAWGAGGGTDTVSRKLTLLAEKALGGPIALSNKTGGTGSVATQAVFEQKADGYTLLFNAENPQLYQTLGLSKLSYDDFEPILLSVQGATVIVVANDSPYQSYADLIAAAKVNPGKISIGISGIGGQPYVTAAIVKKVEGVSFNQVAFDGDGPLASALLGKQLGVSGLAVGAAVPHIKKGDLRALAIMTNSPNPALPDVPPITALNPAYVPIMKASGFFYGVWVKKGTPQPIIDKLTGAFKTAFADPNFQEYATSNGFTLMGISGKEAKDFAKAWQSQMAWLIFESGGAKESPDQFGIPKPTAN
ncbi:MAG: tripartite tricarboxylate transporter substrate binding protein [Proteobacteria bacterium]|nr:tripartite tricarboxylate transporter substrate binding protein [Pseudomonadota bacterium]